MEAVGAAGPRGAGIPGRLRTVAVVAVTVVIIGAVAFWIDNPLAGDGVTGLSLSGAVAAAPPRPGEVPPTFALMTTDGETVHLSDFAGHPVWLTFGASWCSECRAEAADLEAAYQRYREQGLVILAVFQEDRASAADYAERVGLTFPVAVDPDTAVASRYDVVGIPTHVFIGADGVVRVFRVGALTPDDMDRYVGELLG
jgi:cytochrome c biogenesis protein CcmG, thiol:disulfide interchange protein DsbE